MPDEFGLPFAARRVVLSNAGQDADIISAQPSTTREGAWCIVTEKEGDLGYFWISSDNILHINRGFVPGRYNNGCENWDKVTSP
jgi:hypothetical protein